MGLLLFDVLLLLTRLWSQRPGRQWGVAAGDTELIRFFASLSAKFSSLLCFSYDFKPSGNSELEEDEGFSDWSQKLEQRKQRWVRQRAEPPRAPRRGD